MFDEDDYDFNDYGCSDDGGLGLFFFLIIIGFAIFYFVIQEDLMPTFIFRRENGQI